MNPIHIIFVVFFFGPICNGEIRISLNSDKYDGTWSVRNQNCSIRVLARVPGGIYTDLQAAKVLKNNLFYRFNDINYRWVAKDNWIYQIVFDVSPSALQKKAVNIVFYGIDSVGNIYLNGEFLTSVNNMFVRYVLPIKGRIREKNNTLMIQLKSPIAEAERLAQIQKQSYPVPPDCTPDSYNGECHVNFLRKMQSSFSWDWGPAFPSMGIWKSVEIEAYDLGVIRDVVATPIRINSSFWLLNVSYYVEYADPQNIPRHVASGILSLNSATGRKTSVKAMIKEGGNKDRLVANGYIHNAVFYLQQENIDLWWPNGFHGQTLYELMVKIKSLDGAESSMKIVKVGFREVELVQESISPDKPGLSFFFKVNGIPIFAKGSNWIPAHVLPELGSDEFTIRQYLRSAKIANMNMLRVWGGGIYESDLFYEIADELGILIWQDMMFACSMYPTNRDFLDSVTVEIEQQIRRIQHHPSIALWAGNNENEAALRDNWYDTSRNFSLYKQDYVKLYVDTIWPAILRNDKTRSYVTSSPTNGIKSVEEDYIAKDPYSALFGDVHYYNYIFDGWNDHIYPDTRFASEYGFQSMPSYESMSKVTLPTDRKLNSYFSKKRQHLMAGNDYMKGLIKRQLPLPEDDGSEEFYKTFIYYSQISQAMSVKTETEKYRRDRSKLTSDNRGHTMGAMYWQLNDVWQAPSWSSIEFGGKWKMLHYMAKKFFSPILVSIEKSSREKFNVFLVSDLTYDVTDLQLNMSVYAWDDVIPKSIFSYNVDIRKSGSQLHGTYKIDELMKDSGCDKYSCFVYFSLEGSDIFSENVFYPVKLHEVTNIRKPNLTVEVIQTSKSNEAGVRVRTDTVAPFLWLETEEEGIFSDNGFLLLKSRVDLVFVGFRDPIDIDKMKSTLEVRSLL